MPEIRRATMEFKMANRSDTKNGIKLLVQKCREQFRISENFEHYSDREYREAERKYVKLCLRGKIKYPRGGMN